MLRGHGIHRSTRSTRGGAFLRTGRRQVTGVIGRSGRSGAAGRICSVRFPDGLTPVRSPTTYGACARSTDVPRVKEFAPRKDQSWGDEMGDAAPGIGTRAPGFTLESSAGGQMTLFDAVGTAHTILYFFREFS